MASKKSLITSRRDAEDKAISGQSEKKREQLRKEYAEAQALAERFQWAWHTDDKRVGVVLIDNEPYLWRRLSGVLFQLTLLRDKVTATYDIWQGGHTPECGCGRGPDCKHLECVKRLK